jgi:hypothetical protein
MENRLNRTIKLKVAKIIELLVEQQKVEYNQRLCDIQLRLDVIYDTLNNNGEETKRKKQREYYWRTK